jgi:hypothetical protein
VVAKREPGRADGLEHRVPEGLAIIDFRSLCRFEKQTIDGQHLHQSAVAQEQCVLVDLRSVRQMIASWLFPQPPVGPIDQAR